jgi:hypothetical protein
LRTGAGFARFILTGRCFTGWTSSHDTILAQLFRHSPEIRQKAVQLYVDGMNLRRIGRHLRVNPQSVANWAKAHAELLPPAPVPEKVEKAELDELFTFIGDKKTGFTS